MISYCITSSDRSEFTKNNVKNAGCMQHRHTSTSLSEFSWYHSPASTKPSGTCARHPIFKDLKHTPKAQRCKETPPPYSHTVLLNRTLSHMHEGSQRCQHLQSLDRPLKPDLLHTHTHHTHAQHAISGSTWREGMPTAVRLGKHPSENQTTAIIPLITHTHIYRSYCLWSLEGD